MPAQDVDPTSGVIPREAAMHSDLAQLGSENTGAADASGRFSGIYTPQLARLVLHNHHTKMAASKMKSYIPVNYTERRLDEAHLDKFDGGQR